MSSVTTFNAENMDYPYAHTKAVRMLSKAIDEMAERNEGSLRQCAGRLGYKSAVVLSHMRTGRLPIPVDRASEIAKITRMDEAEFLLAVLEQRFPNIDFVRLITKGDTPDTSSLNISDVRLMGDLEAAAGKPISSLSNEHIGVLREVVVDSHPRARWLSLSEATVVDFIRRDLPEIARDGLTSEDAEKIKKAVIGK